MVNLNRLRLTLFTVAPLCLFVSHSFAQQEPALDLWKFPSLTQSKHFQRWWWRFQQRAYPLDKIPDGAKLRALEQIKQSKAVKSSASPPPTAQPVQASRWINIGPAPIQTYQPVSGRVTSIAVDPSDSTHWLIGAAQGGIWETRDGGSTWSPKTDDQASLAMGAIAFAPSNPNTIYGGTGEANFSLYSYAGAGLLKSTDGGNTWALLATSTFAKVAFSAIRVHPTNPDMVLAATSRSGTSPPSVPSRGIFKSIDGGVTWSSKVSGEATALEVDPANFNNQYAGIGAIWGGGSNGVYRSTDAGETWTPISGPWAAMAGGVGRIALAIAPSNPNVMYVSIQDAIDNVGNDGKLLGIWQTNNAWDAIPSWTQLPMVDAGNQLWFDLAIIVDPTNSNVVYFGTTPLFKFDGSAWANITHIHLDQHAMFFVGNRLIVGNDGGVWSTTDGGNSWNDHNTNLAITQFYYGSVHPSRADFALGGSQDNGTDLWRGSNGWRALPCCGDGGASAISASNPDNYWAASTERLGIQRTTDGGSTFTAVDSGIDKTGVLFIAPLAKCPANDDVFIAGTDNLWRSNNFFSGATPLWSSNGPEMGSGISALAFAPSDTNCKTYVFGTASGELRLTMDGGTTWNDIDTANSVPNRYVTGLAFDPTNPNILYVSLSGFDEGTPGQPGHLFKTTNALSSSPTWTNISPPVNIPHNSIVLDPSSPGVIYVGTDLGVWKSSNAGETWTHMGPESGMPNVAVFDMKINQQAQVLAFTYGRSAFMLTSDTTPPTGAITINSGAGYTNSTSVTLNLSATDAVGVTGYYTSVNSTAPLAGAAGWVAISSTTSLISNLLYTLSSGEGTKTVYAWYKDSAGDVSNTVSYSIVLDQTSPTNGTLTATAGNAQVALSWSGFSDGGSGLAGSNTYKLVFGTGSTPASCGSGTQIFLGSGTSFIHTSRVNGTTYFYRVCAFDNAGNVSSGATAQATPSASDTTAPAAPIGLTASPLGWTNVNSFTLSWTNPSDPSGIAAAWYKVGSVPTSASDGTRVAGSSIQSIPGVQATAQGGQNIYVWLEDGAGNKDHNNPSSTTLQYDATAPTGGTIAINNGAASTSSLIVTLNSLGATETMSGLSQMRFSNDNSTWSAWESYGSTRNGWDLSQFGGNTDSGTKTVYVQYMDVAGNQSSSFNDTINYALPTVSINDVSVTEGNSGTTNAVFAVTLSPASSQTVTVSYSTANDTATGGASCTAGIDYISKSLTTLTFTPGGATSQPISVSVCGDTVPEPNKTFFINLTSPTNATIAKGQGMGTIIDDDGPGVITVVCPGDSLQAAINAAEPGTTISIFGTCNENVLVDNNKMKVFLIGSGGATIDGGSYDPTNPTNSSTRFGPETLDVRGKAILIQGLTITGGRNAILVHRLANAVINNNVIQNAAEAGIAVEEEAFAVITGNTVQSNGGDGIRVSTSSGANIGFNNSWDTSPSPNTIQNNGLGSNGGRGIHIQKSSHANIAGNLITNNHDDGIAVLRISHADIEGNEIHGNGGNGVLVSNNSEADLGNNSSPISFFNAVNTTTGTNTLAGIQCDESSVARGHQGTLNGAGGAQIFSPSCVTTNLVNP